ncbi:hypothetical protein AB6A40_003412 [Gnathostoma spinigerum]|uniref:Mitochondrial ornithine transporter 1 n=1 Tax=Gnathostoma spinigerum TaxID=75299 RepID=A0ABD6E9H4_9BILA
MEQVELETNFSHIQHLKDGVIDLTAGTAAGIANVYAGQPLDTVKVKMQAFPELYRNGVSCFRETLRLDGVRGLYAGTIPALIANIAENAVLFTAYGYCQKSVAYICGRQQATDMTPTENATAGSLAAIFAGLVLCPTELIKCRLQSQRETNPLTKATPWSVCREMYRKQGIRSLFYGLSPTLAREVPGYFFFFGAYETSRYYFTVPGKTKDDIGLTRTAISGAIGGTALWTAVFPFDVVKSRMQITGNGHFGSMLFQIFKNEGVMALYKGLAPTVLRTCLASSSLFVVYEETKKLLNLLFP